jgi:hypothetical protein
MVLLAQRQRSAIASTQRLVANEGNRQSPIPFPAFPIDSD